MDLFANRFYAAVEEDSELVAEGARKLVDLYVGQNVTRGSNFGSERVNKFFAGVQEIDTYKEANEKYGLGLLKHAAKGTSFEGLSTYAEFKAASRKLQADAVFQSRLYAVLSESVGATLPAISSAAHADLAEYKFIPYGDSVSFEVESNETFFVWELAEGVATGAAQRLYNNEVTVTPKATQIRIELDWYQLVTGMFNFGRWLYRIGVSYAGYISAKAISALTSSENNIPAGYKVSGAYAQSNFVKIAENVAAANGNARVSAWGTLSALQNVIPAATGFSYGERDDLTQIGYIGRVAGVDLVQIKQFMKPGKVNTLGTSDTLGLSNTKLYFFAGPDKPIKVVYEGESTVIEKDGNNADVSVGIKITTRVGIAAVLGQIYGVLTISG